MSKQITPELIEAFDSEAWLKEREEGRGAGWSWDDLKRLKNIFHMMKTFELTNPNQLKIKHFNEAKVAGSFKNKECNYKHSIMIAQVLEKFDYAIDTNAFQVHMTAGDLKKYLA